MCVFQLNLEGTKVRRQLPIGELPNDVDSRTVYVVKKVLWCLFDIFAFYVNFNTFHCFNYHQLKRAETILYITPERNISL